MKQVYLLTGRPGTGKTSLIKQAVAGMEGKAGGFYTEEIRIRGVREGFRLVTLDGQEVILAHVDINGPYRVSKYGVDVDSLDRVGVSALHKAAQQCDLVVIDEIGKMELFSANFRWAVSQMIDSGKRILGTIMFNPNSWADVIKRQPQVKLVTVTRTNRQDVLEGLLHWLKATEKDNGDGRRIIIRPLAQIDSQILEILKQNLEHTFNRSVEIEAEIGSLDYAYDPKRKQYLSPRLLAGLLGFSKEPGDRCLGIVDVDLYSPGLNFVFGEADIGSGVAIVSLYHLKPERYGLHHNVALFQDRAVKEAVHELGHTYRLSHCQDVKCVMHFSNSLADTDIKGTSFCPKCEQKLKEAI